MDSASIVYQYPSQDPRTSKAGADATTPSDAGTASLFTAGGPSFKDLIDTINPLQQLPIVGSIYRAVTGDTISPASQMAGGALYGGPLGFMAGAINAGLQAATGSDVATHLASLFDGGNSTGTQYAAAAYQKTQSLLS